MKRDKVGMVGMENDAVISCIKRTRTRYRSWRVELTHGSRWYVTACICMHVSRICARGILPPTKLYSNVGQIVRDRYLR